MRFAIKPHSYRAGVDVVEVFDDDGIFIATIVPESSRMIKVVSKFVLSAEDAPPLIPALVVTVGEQEVCVQCGEIDSACCFACKARRGEPDAA